MYEREKITYRLLGRHESTVMALHSTGDQTISERRFGQESIDTSLCLIGEPSYGESEFSRHLVGKAIDKLPLCVVIFDPL